MEFAIEVDKATSARGSNIDFLSEQEQEALEEVLQGQAMEFAIEVDKATSARGSDRDEDYVPEALDFKQVLLKCL